MYTHGVTCFGCHDVHGTENDADLLGPHAATIEAHTLHAAGSAGSECVACHMPKIEQQRADTNLRAHTFKFMPSSETLKAPNACNVCHGDKTMAGAKEKLQWWPEFSAWRVGLRSLRRGDDRW